jgi:hypothetical protein
MNMLTMIILGITHITNSAIHTMNRTMAITCNITVTMNMATIIMISTLKYFSASSGEFQVLIRMQSVFQSTVQQK